MARKGILTPGLTDDKRPKPTPRMMPRGAVGALQSSLSKLQENAVQELDSSLIDDAGFEDRLGLDHGAQEQLKQSLREYGQQVPVLVRPHPKQAGRYEIVYGRRRLMALRDLGLPVKAMVRHLDDHALVLAQGQENTARQDLSFVEKASFAAQLKAAGYDNRTIAAALSTDEPMVTRLLKVGEAFDLSFLRQIGAAPKIGRDRWLSLVALFQDSAARSRALTFMNRPEFAQLDSNARFEAVHDKAAQKQTNTRPAPTKPRSLRTADGKPLGEIKRAARGVTLTLPTRLSEGFEGWFDTHAETILQELHARWQQDSEN